MKFRNGKGEEIEMTAEEFEMERNKLNDVDTITIPKEFTEKDYFLVEDD